MRTVIFRALRILAAAALVAIGPGSISLRLAANAATADPDRFEPEGGGWQSYVNGRFGTSLDFPAKMFRPSPPPENGDGRRFTSPDATLEVYAFNNVNQETARSMKRRLVGSEGYRQVTYSPTGPGWLVLSGFRGKNIFYEKYFFRGDTIQGFGIEFPRAAKPRYAPVIERIENSFRAM
jgi:hypothetical protein